MKVTNASKIGKKTSKSSGRKNEISYQLAPLPSNDGWELALIPEDDDDIYTISAVVRPGDIISATTTRNHAMSEGLPSQRITMWLSAQVELVSYAPSDSTLRIKARVCAENQYLSIGTYHTFSIQQNVPLRVWKSDPFDKLDLELLQEAIAADRVSNLRAIVMQEDIAHIAIVTPVRMILKARITSKHRGKRAAAELALRKKGSRVTDAFFSDIIAVIMALFPNITQSPILVASPGFTAQDFRKFCKALHERVPDKYPGLDTVAKTMIVAHSSTGHLHGLNEALRNGAVADSILGSQERLLADFKRRVMADDPRAVYSPRLVKKAFEAGAITGNSKVFVGTNFFFERDMAKRAEVSQMVQRMREAGAEVIFMPANQENGDQLYLLGGMAAVLSFPVPGLDEMDEGEAEEEEEEEEEKLVPFAERAVEGMVV